MTLYKAPPSAMASEDRTRVRFAPGSQILSAESLITGYPDMTSYGIRRPQHERLIWTGIDNQALDSLDDEDVTFKYRSVQIRINLSVGDRIYFSTFSAPLSFDRRYRWYSCFFLYFILAPQIPAFEHVHVTSINKISKNVDLHFVKSE